MFKKSIIVAVALLAAIGCTTVSAQAPQEHTNPSRQVVIGNGTPDIIAGIFASISGENEWAGNILEGEGPMMPGTPFGIDFTNETNACEFDIKLFIVANDAVHEVNFEAFDVCNNDKLVIVKKSPEGGVPPGHPPVGGEPPKPAPSLNPPPRQFNI